MIVLKRNDTVVDEHFIAVAMDLFKMKLEKNPPRHQRACEALLYYQTDKGKDVMITRLKRLEYSLFTAIKSADQLYLKAVTKEMNTKMRGNEISIGAYTIYVSLTDLYNGDISRFHFIPNRYPRIPDSDDRMTHYRHLHHYAVVKSPERGGRKENPLTYETNTCWGSFGSMVPTIVMEGDLPELFRTLYLFLYIQNPSSPLVSYRDLERNGIYKPITYR